VALAPYFDGFDASVTNTTHMVERYRRALRETLQGVAEHAVLVRAANMSLLAYEAGPGAPVGTFNDVGIGAVSLTHCEQLRHSPFWDLCQLWSCC
jgi:hypothetical protein